MASKIKNFRDLGGLRSENGKTVKRGLIYRSAHLCSLTPKAADSLQKRIGLATVVDLRSPSELADKTDVISKGIKYLHIPPLNDEQNPAVTGKSRRAILNRIMAKEGGARKHLSDTYRLMVTAKPALDSFSAIVKLLIDRKNAPILWHCTQGKDRTGIAAACVLMALGVPREEIMKDYLRTNRSSWFKNAMIYVGVFLITFSKHTADELDLLLTAHSCYMEAAFFEIDKLYGGTEGFLKDGLGLTEKDITYLRESYLA